MSEVMMASVQAPHCSPCLQQQGWAQASAQLPLLKPLYRLTVWMKHQTTSITLQITKKHS